MPRTRDDVPIVDPAPAGPPRWLLIVLPFAGLLVGLAIAGPIGYFVGRSNAPVAPVLPGPGPLPAEHVAVVDRQVDWSAVTTKASVGTVDVEAIRSMTGQIAGFRFGQFAPQGPLCYVMVKLTNNSPTKVVEFTGWHGLTSASDEHGNAYKPWLFGSGFKLPAGEFTLPVDGCDCSDPLPTALQLHPGKCYIVMLYFDQPADIAKEFRVAAPASALGGKGSVFFKVTPTRPK